MIPYAGGMKYLHYAIFLTLMIPCLAWAQTDEKAILSVEKALMAAVLKGDAAAADQYMASDSVFVAPDGSVTSKSGMLSDLKSGDLKLTSSKDSDMKVVASTADMAVVTYSTVDKGSYKGEEIDGTFRWMDVLAKRDGKWQVVASQGTEVPEK